MSLKNLFSILFLLTLSLAQLPVEGSHKNNVLIPQARFVVDPVQVTDNSALSFLGEVGVRNYRANATYGFYLTPCLRAKIGGEGLAQKLHYGIKGGKSYRWMHQYAVGGELQYLVCNPYISSLDLYGHYSHAPSRSLKTIHRTPLELIRRRIAGSDAWNLGAGFTFNPWCSSKISLSADYDHVRYNRHFHHNKVVSGVGGTINILQQLPCDFILGFRGEFKRPYDYIEGSLNYSTCTPHGNLVVGLYAGYTKGKEHLPNVTVAGVQIGFELGNFINSSCNSCCSPCDCGCDFSWVAIPAVYVPEVLAIGEHKVHKLPPPCVPPAIVAVIPTQNLDQLPPIDIPTAPFFSGSNLQFSLFNPNPNQFGATINPNTGVITITSIASGRSSLTVTASNDCGSVSQTFIIQSGI